MKYLSLFTGIGGFELGIQYAIQDLLQSEKLKYEAENPVDSEGGLDSVSSTRLGNPVCIGFSEIDKYAAKVYQHHFPTHHNYGDITKINADELPDFDLLVGGFPCQAFSIAGKRKGFDDTRGTLFFDIARILRAKQPRLFLLENVKGLLSHDNGNTFKTIISTLDELGYDLQWQVLNSKNHGVPQSRERIFIVGHLRGTSRPQVFPFRGANQEVASIVQLNSPTHSNDRVYGENGISPTLNTMQGGNRQPFVKVPEATSKGYAEAEIGDSINLSVPNSKTRRGRVGKGIAQTLDTGMHQHTLSSDMKIRRLTPTECERLQGFPDGWTVVENTSDSQRYKMCGNAVTVNVIRDIVENLLAK